MDYFNKQINASGSDFLPLSFRITSTAAEKVVVELFGGLDSFLHRKKANNVLTNNFPLIPLSSFEGQALAGAGNPTFGTVGLDASGNLKIYKADGAASVTVECLEYPYASLIQALKENAFRVAYTRFTVTTDNQIGEQWTVVKKTMSGSDGTTRINPRSFQKPSDNQDKIVDVATAFDVNPEDSLLIPVVAGETIQVTFYLQTWTKTQL